MWTKGQRGILVVAISVAIVGSAAAQSDYPVRAIKVIVPIPPGTILDLIPRMIGNKLSQKWDQAVIIENRPGAAQNIGAEAVARAEPDGYTLLVTPPGPLAVSQWFFPKIGFDPAAFVPITILVKLPTVLVVNSTLPVSTLPELIAYSKTRQQPITYGSPGAGSTPQLAMEALMRRAGVEFVHVPYQGMVPAQRDLLAGHIDVMIDLVGNALAHIQDGRLKALAVTSETRLAALGNVPTVAETLPGYVHTEWFAMMAPPKTPLVIASKLSQAVAEVLRLPDVAQRLHGLSVTPVGSSPADTAAFVQQQSDRWRQVIASTVRKVD